MSTYIHKSHNVTTLLYHLVCVVKYRRAVLTEPVNFLIREICLEIAKRYELHFLEIGADNDHLHFLIQSVPTMPPQRLAQIVKSLTARHVFKQYPEVKKDLWGGEFWTKGYFINTVGRTNSENAIRQYIKSQGQTDNYHQLHQTQLVLFNH